MRRARPELRPDPPGIFSGVIAPVRPADCCAPRHLISVLGFIAAQVVKQGPPGWGVDRSGIGSSRFTFVCRFKSDKPTKTCIQSPPVSLGDQRVEQLRHFGSFGFIGDSSTMELFKRNRFVSFRPSPPVLPSPSGSAATAPSLLPRSAERATGRRMPKADGCGGRRQDIGVDEMAMAGS